MRTTPTPIPTRAATSPSTSSPPGVSIPSIPPPPNERDYSSSMKGSLRVNFATSAAVCSTWPAAPTPTSMLRSKMLIRFFFYCPPLRPIITV
eukprot:9476491-Pyramimonas_sp.AAC.1